MNEKTREATWLRLDNAAKLYPAINRRSYSSVFRMAAVMTEPVDAARLQRALEDIMPRFPSFNVGLHRGAFWYYLDWNPNTPRVRPEAANPCMPFRWKENEHFLFRVHHYDRRISLEIFHALTDASGASVFLQTLIAQYLRLGGHDIPSGGAILDLNEEPHPEESEDAFSRYATSGVRVPRVHESAYHIRDPREPVHTLHIISGTIPLERALELARDNRASLTEYLAATLLRALLIRQQNDAPRRLRRVVISVPVNLRRFFPSRTLRNFSSFVNVGVDPRHGEFTMQELIQVLHHTMRLNTNAKTLNATFSGNVRSERNPLLRLAPLFLKNAVVSLVADRVGESAFSGTISNLGSIQLPEAAQPHVERFELILGVSRLNGVNAAVISYKDELVVSFTSNIAATDVQREFFTYLVEQGLPVLVQTNMP